jgi:anti-sigma regulatory factor (Ser/Thr protein kinase)
VSETENLEIRFELPARLEILRPLNAFVRELLARALPDLRKTSDEIILVLHEAFTNVCQHAYASIPDGVVAVRVCLTETQVELHFEDQGAAFDEENWKGPDPDSVLESGRGVWLMKQLMNEFIYESKPGEKNVLKLVKKLPHRVLERDDRNT